MASERRQDVGTLQPSITYSVPVIEAAHGDAGNAIRSATSLGFEAAERNACSRNSVRASPQSWVGLAQIAAATNDAAAAERALRQALKLEPSFVPALVNLSDLMGRIGRDSEGEALLRDAIRRVPKEANLQESLDLSLVRQKRKSEALKVLASAQALPTASARTSYLHAAALADAGRVREAIIVLETAARKRGDREVLLALASYKRDAGDEPGARAALDRLAAINPGDPAVRGGAVSVTVSRATRAMQP